MRPEPNILCACQWGICGACDGTADQGRPRHDRCLSRKHGHPIVYPFTWATDKNGFVVGSPLWSAVGSPCRYICPCPCNKTGPITAPARRVAAKAPTHRPAPEPVVVVADGALFDLAVVSE